MGRDFMFCIVRKIYIGVSYNTKKYGMVYVYFEREEEHSPYYRYNNYFNIYGDMSGNNFLEDITYSYLYDEEIGESNKKIMGWTIADNF